MMRAVGVVLLAFGGAYMGFHAAGELSAQVHALEELGTSLALLEQELELGGWDLGTCFRAVARRTGGAGQSFFSACADGMGRLEEEDFPSLWARLCGELPIGPEGQRILSTLGNILGRCETHRQRQALASVRGQLDRLAGESREEFRRRGKVFQAVGVSAGAFLAILLL